MTNKKSSSWDTFKGVVKITPKKEKILLIAQTAFSVIILVLIFLGSKSIIDDRLSQIVGMGLLVILFIISALRIIETRRIFAGIYFVAAGIVSIFFLYTLLQ